MKSPIVIIGIDTEVGKTIVATIIAEALKAHYWKPIQCGMPRDSEWVESNLTNKNAIFPECHLLKTPCSPHLAAKKEGVMIEAKKIRPPHCSGPLVIEGTGGLLAPLNESENWADAALLWQAHFILVHRHYLGSLNHFFLTIEALKLRKLPLLGVVFNGESDLETEEMLLKKAHTQCLGKLLWQKNLTSSYLHQTARDFRPQIMKALGD